MNALIRPVFAVAVASLLAVSLLGLRSVCDPAGLRALIHEDRRNEQLQQFEHSTFRHIECRKQVVRELIAQGCSLSEAKARWQELDLEWLQELAGECPELAIGISMIYRRLWSDADYYYRLITEEAAGLLRDRPEEAALVLHRLEEEHQRLQAGKQAPSFALRERTKRSR